MGVNIDDSGNVYIDFSHERLVDTSTTANPSQWRPGSFVLLSLLRRKPDADITADGSPVMHAIKGHPKYKIDKWELGRLSRRATHIAKKLGNNLVADAIVIAPSGSPVNLYIARRIKRHLFSSVAIYDCLEKRTIGEIVSMLKGAPMSPTNRRVAGHLLAVLEGGKPHLPIQMKRMDKRFSHLIKPVKLKAGHVMPPPGSAILLIDDLYSSGSTVEACVSELMQACSPKSITVLTLFSPLRTKR
ncbi:MAG: phosphoribosyltransferase [Magnetospirillum sp.]|nr:phosphoribosyltransferase [Magnetospirillum sp.]